MRTRKIDLLQGTLDMLILKTVALEPIHGYGISQRLTQMSRQVLDVRQGSLYPALHRLEKQKVLRAEWHMSESGHLAKYYSLTEAGRKRLEGEKRSWHAMTTAIGWVLETEK